MRTKYLCYFLYSTLTTQVVAQTGHQGPSKRTKEFIGPYSLKSHEYKGPLAIADDENNNYELLQPTENTQGKEIYSYEAPVAALTLAFWSMTKGKMPNNTILNQAGLKKEDVKAFFNSLDPSERLNTSDQNTLSAPYKKGTFNKRNSVRKKFLNFVSKFQEAFPIAADLIPEILTVWGEARNIKGFEKVDSMYQQAKMATVVHVIRNRTIRRSKRSRHAKKPNYKNKWEVVTRRYQFSAFEPYDPNLSQLAFGPLKRGTYTSLDSLPRNDRVALVNLSKVISRMNREEILLPKPLAFNNIYHYLTPQLEKYSDETFAEVDTKLQKKGSRFMLIKIPTTNPKHYAPVPKWSKQSALIAKPPVKIKDDQSPLFETHVVLPEDFVYFRGIR